MFLLCVCCAVVFYYIYKLVIRPFNFWKKLGVPYAEPVPLLGNIKDFIFASKHLVFVYDDIYKTFKDQQYVGIYEMLSPNLLIGDPELINRVLIQDFSSFYDRGVHIDEELDPLDAHLVNLSGNRWKRTRSKLMPAFSAGRLKHMYFLMQGVVRELDYHLESRIKEGNTTMDLREIMAKFSTDVIGRCALGLECNTLNDPNSEFKNIGTKIFAFPYTLLIRICLKLINPKLLKWIRIKSVSVDVERFFFKLLYDAVKYRKSDDRKIDFLQLMIDIQEREKESKHEIDDPFSDTLLVANMFVFFAGGFETTANTLSFCLYELATNQDIQNKLRNEIRTASEKTELNYDTVNNLPYLDMVICETLRKFAPIPFLSRVCSNDYVIPGTSTVLPAGTRVTIPVYSLHYDDKYFSNAKEFRPERFENVDDISQLYLPFGNGPRICIGSKLAKIEIKCCLAMILLKYSFSQNERTEIPLQIKSRSIFLTPKNGVVLNVTKI